MRDYKYDLVRVDQYIKDSLIKWGKYSGETKKAIDDSLIEHKREYRADLKKRTEKKYLYPNNYGEIVNGGGDFEYRWMKVFFEGEHWNDDDKKKFIEENWVDYEWSPYDCTEQIYTQRICVFNVPSGVVAYIMELKDV